MYLPVAQLGAPQHILAVFRSLSSAQVAAGRRWYADAHAETQRLGAAWSFTAVTVAAVIAALSPSLRWRQNLVEAAKVLAAVRQGRRPAEVRVTAYPAAGDRAFAIARTGDIALLAGPKTTAFFHNIAFPTTPGPVTVDRHALRIWLGQDQPGALTCRPSTYYLAVADYIAAAETVGLPPHELQAATWLTLAKE